jgi:nucleotide-binding universal stress UspA family protein
VDEAAAPAASDGSTNGALRPSVVCGVDGSAESKAAVALATRLAERLGSRLVLAHVIDARHRNHIPVGIAAGAVGARRISVPTDEHVRAAVAVGFAADRLADLAEEERAELLVVGSRGRGGLKAAFLGSVSSSLIGVARCPVQVVRPGIPGS